MKVSYHNVGLQIYPQYTGSMGGDGRYYDMTLVKWDDFIERYNSLQDNKSKVEFLESMIFYPPVHRVLAPEPFAYSHEEVLLPDDVRRQRAKQRGVQFIEPFIVQREHGFDEFVFGELAALTKHDVYPIFFSDISSKTRQPSRFDLTLIEHFGDNVLDGNPVGQNRFYSGIEAKIKAIPESKLPYSEKKDLLFVFNKKVDKRKKAALTSTLKFIKAKIILHKNSRPKDLQKDHKEIHHEEVELKPYGLAFLADIPWLGSTEAYTEVCTFLNKFGQLGNDRYYFEKMNGPVNVFYFFIRLRELSFIPIRTPYKSLAEAIWIVDKTIKKPTNRSSWSSYTTKFNKPEYSTGLDQNTADNFERIISKHPQIFTL